MQTSPAGIAFIADHEGFSATAYGGEDNPEGRKTIGYGHLIQDGEEFLEPMTEEQARQLLAFDLGHTECAINEDVKADINQFQFDALASLTYNIGVAAFRTSTLLKLLNAGSPPENVAAEFLKWCHDEGKVSAGLAHRRMAEKALFLAAQQDQTDGMAS